MNPIDIDITDLTSNEIINILQDYPRGQIKINFERVFWSADPSQNRRGHEPPQGMDPRYFDPRNPPRGGKLNQAFGSMADTLGRMVSPPPRRDDGRR